MKKFITILLFLFTPIFLYSENLKDSICIVERTPSKKEKAFLEEQIQYFNSLSLKQYASTISNYLDKAFGTGFLFTTEDGKQIIITNNHVINGTSFATIKFENQDGTYLEYKDLKIIYKNKNLDIAFIEVPKNLNKPSLSFYNKKIKDGMDIWSAGFPGLNGVPMWQLGKGIVSNSKAYVKDLLNDDIKYVIQHTAPVDPGNSGGPLLIQENGSYYVIGINTWKAFYRENTNFTIPIEFLKENFEIKKNKLDCDKVLDEFIKAVNTEEADLSILASFISDEMVYSLGGKILRNVISTSTEVQRKRILDEFVTNPIDGFRYAIGLKIYNDLNKKNTSIVGKNEEKDGLHVIIKYDEREIDSCWKKSDISMELIDISIIEKVDYKTNINLEERNSKKKEKQLKRIGNSSFYKETPYFFDCSGSFFVSGPRGIDLSLALNAQHFGGGIGFSITGNNYGDFYYLFGRIQYPISNKFILINPSVDFRFSPGIDNKLSFGIMASIDSTFRLIDILPLSIGAFYLFEKKEEIKPINKFGIKFGYKY